MTQFRPIIPLYLDRQSAPHESICEYAMKETIMDVE